MVILSPVLHAARSPTSRHSAAILEQPVLGRGEGNDCHMLHTSCINGFYHDLKRRLMCTLVLCGKDVCTYLSDNVRHVRDGHHGSWRPSVFFYHYQQRFHYSLPHSSLSPLFQYLHISSRGSGNLNLAFIIRRGTKHCRQPLGELYIFSRHSTPLALPSEWSRRSNHPYLPTRMTERLAVPPPTSYCA